MIKRSCPDCGAGLVLFFSTREKICSGCYKEFPWNLDEGQKPIFSESKRGEVTAEDEDAEEVSS